MACGAMLSLAIFGGNRIDGSMLDPGERVIALALFGGIEFDFASAPPPPAADVVIITLFGGASVRANARQTVRMTGVSLFGGRSIEPLPRLPSPADSESDDDDDLELPIDITAWAVFGNVNVKRVGGAPQ